MSHPPTDEPLRRPQQHGEADAVTVSFADRSGDLCGLVRLGVANADGALTGSALVIIFRGQQPVAGLARGGVEIGDAPSWSELEIAGLTHTTITPAGRWRLRWEGSGQSLELELSALSSAAAVGADEPYVEAGGMAGYGQLVHVRGTATIDGTAIPVDGPGQRDRAWGVADWDRLAGVRTVSAWWEGDAAGAMLGSARPAGAEHDGEAVWAYAVAAGDPTPVAEPRLSTTYDADGRPRRVGLELWMEVEEEAGDGEEPEDEDGLRLTPTFAAGEVVCGSTLDLGDLRLDVAFVRWHGNGREGLGRYDLVRRVEDDSPAR